MNENHPPQDFMNRRRFLLLTVAAVATAGCRSTGDTASHEEHFVDAGPVGNYATDGVYDQFRDQGFFIIRKGGKLFALSAVCTHKKCKLSAEEDRSFFCKCHGSTFDPDGKVTEGPAKRDLPVLSFSTNETRHLIVKVPKG